MFFNKEKKVEVSNPLEAKIGSTVVIDTLDFRDKELLVKDIVEYKRQIGTEKFLFTDYHLSNEFKLRVMPDFVLTLNLYREFEFDEDFLSVVEDACASGFNIDDEDAHFNRCNNLTDPYSAELTSAVKKSKVKYWDFSRQATDEAGYEYTDFVMVEQDEETGWFQVWWGQETLKSNVKVV